MSRRDYDYNFGMSDGDWGMGYGSKINSEYVKAPHETRWLVDALWCQPIKLIQVVSTSEFHEYWWKDVDFFFRPLHLLQGLRTNNIK